MRCAAPRRRFASAALASLALLATYAGKATAGMIPLPPANTLASAAVFVNVAGPANVSLLGPFSYASAALTPSGTSLQALTSASQWSTVYGTVGTLSSKIILQFNGITDTGPTQNGGAAVDIVDLTSLGGAPTALGGSYRVPVGCELTMGAGFATEIVSGAVFCNNIATQTLSISGAAADLSQNEIVAPIGVTNSFVLRERVRP